MASEIREMRTADRPLVETLYREVFGPDALDLWRQRFEWQFRDSPAVARRPSKMWVAEKDGGVVGFLAAFPVRLSVRGAESVILCPCDLMVSPEARGEQLGVRLIQSYIKDAGDLANALAYSPAAARVYDKLGYRSVAAESVYLRPVRAGRIVRAAAHKRYKNAGIRDRALRTLASCVAPIATAGVSAVNAFRSPRPSAAIRVVPISAFGPEFDRLWLSVSAAIPLICARDAGSLEWRFVRDPLTRHTILAARDSAGALRGYAVGCDVVRAGVRIGKIMDVVCTPDDARGVVPALAQALLSHFRDRSVDLVVTKGLHPAIQREMRKSLYVGMPGPDMPARVRWEGDPSLADTVYDAANWHLSHADGDEDFVP